MNDTIFQCSDSIQKLKAQLDYKLDWLFSQVGISTVLHYCNLGGVLKFVTCIESRNTILQAYH